MKRSAKRSATWVLGLLCTALIGSPGRADPGIIKLVPHRAVYDLSLLSSSGSRGVESARGRIAYEFSGNACEGYTINYRQVTLTEDGEGSSRLADLRTTSFEDGGGRAFRFRTQSRLGFAPTKQIEGDVRKSGNGTVLRLAKPKRGRFDIGADVLFPTAHLQALIAAARADRRLLSARTFDGSDDGRSVYDTLAVIGRSSDGGRSAEGIEKVAGGTALGTVAHWPVSVSYYAEQGGRGERLPTYTLSFELYENGISRNLKLDYNDFSLAGELKQLEILPETPCDR